MKINLLIFVCLIHIVSFAQPNNRSWVKGLGGTTGDIGHSVVTDNSGNIYVTGLFNGTIDFDPGHDIYNVTSISQDFFILKLNEFGEFQWVKSFQTTGTETGLDVTLDVNNNLVVCGQFSGTVDFDPGLSTFNLTSSALDIFVLKLNFSCLKFSY